MKSILIVNNNMKIGGVQKSLCNLLWSIKDQYDITLCLFSPVGEYMEDLPPNVKIISCDSPFYYLGVSQKECAHNPYDFLVRGMLAFICKLFGRKAVMPLILKGQKRLPSHYDCAISYLQNGNQHNFYGGCNEFVLEKVDAKRKVAFLHCDYLRCGANCDANNAAYKEFDAIAACSDGCRESFIQAMPELAAKCKTVPNFHRYDKIRALADENTYAFDSNVFNVVMVGRLAHEKGIDRAIRAIQYVRGQGIPAMLHLIGSGPMEKELRTMVDELKLTDAVVFHGSQSNPYRFMRDATLLLITSWHEAAPMVIDEACALSLPVLTVATTSSDEMVVKRGCGWVCGNDQASLNDMLAAVLKNADSICDIRERLVKCRFDNGRANSAFNRLIGAEND